MKFDEGSKIDEAIDYVIWLLKDLDPDNLYDFYEVRMIILSIIGHLTSLKGEKENEV